jgi:hypothetical protein
MYYDSVKISNGRGEGGRFWVSMKYKRRNSLLVSSEIREVIYNEDT